MEKKSGSLYKIYKLRDAEYDGLFFIGVTSTRIFCRPVCKAKTPLEKNCRFFASAEAAEKAGFRACKRCRPELAPGFAPVDDSKRIAGVIAGLLNEGELGDLGNMDDIAARFELSARQIRRILSKELGVSFIDMLQARRLSLAKKMLKESDVLMTEVAFASGYSSLRRFNDSFRKDCGVPPSEFRKKYN